MRLYYCDHFVLPLPEGHRFPMEKYAGVRRRVEADPATPDGALTVPEAATDEDALLLGVRAGDPLLVLVDTSTPSIDTGISPETIPAAFSRSMSICA